MLAWSIEHALQCPEIDRVVVSTDSEQYASIAESFGAEVPRSEIKFKKVLVECYQIQ